MVQFMYLPIYSMCAMCTKCFPLLYFAPTVFARHLSLNIHLWVGSDFSARPLYSTDNSQHLATV